MTARRGYIALTDPDWYAFLRGQPRVDEVNFWQPHGNRRFQAVAPGDPFFFKLRAPRKWIAGFGFFERYEALPAWLAWDCFGPMNGASDMETMIASIARLRKEDGPGSSDMVIGCIMVAAPVFFAEDEWVEPPRDWAKTGIQQGKGYALDSGEGERVLLECMERASSKGRYWNVEREPGERYGPPTLVRPRYGQGLFSFSVRDAYRGACAVTGEHSAPVLEAAHIVPYSRGGEHRVDNGLLLRSDLHRLYDRGYVTVSPDHEFIVGERLREDYRNGRSYYGLSGTKIALPDLPAWRPNREHLEWHRQHQYLG